MKKMDLAQVIRLRMARRGGPLDSNIVRWTCRSCKHVTEKSLRWFYTSPKSCPHCKARMGNWKLEEHVVDRIGPIGDAIGHVLAVHFEQLSNQK
jgi:hypothetical protein